MEDVAKAAQGMSDDFQDMLTKLVKAGDTNGVERLLNEEAHQKNILIPKPNPIGWYDGVDSITNIFGGTGNPVQLAKRRAKNKLAKRSRKTNRRKG